MRLIFLGTVYLLFFWLVVRSEGSFNLTEEKRSRNPALAPIEDAKKIVAKLDVGQAAGKSATNILDELAKNVEEVGQLNGGGDSGKIKAIGDAATATATFIQSVVNGELKSANKWNDAVLSLTETFANIGGALAPPPLGQAISSGFGIINTFMSLAGFTEKVPSMKDIIKDLIEDQTQDIVKIVGEVLNEFWEEVLADSKAVLALLRKSRLHMKNYINTPSANVTCSVRTDIKDFMTSTNTEMTMLLGGTLTSKMNKHCAMMKEATDEHKCLILLEYYSRIYKTYIDLQLLAIQIFNKHENRKNLKECGQMRSSRMENKWNNNDCHRGLVCDFYIKIRLEADLFREDLFKPFLENDLTRQNGKTSKLCLKTKILTTDRFPYIKLALKSAGVKLELTQSEESSKDIVCPSSKTKLMLVGGDTDKWGRQTELLSPFKKCQGIKELPEMNIRPAVASYTSTSGDKRVMVCGGQTFLNIPTEKCYSINQTGSNWVQEADMQASAKASMVWDKFNMHQFGGYTVDNWRMYNLDIWMYPYSSRPYIPKASNEGVIPPAFEQIWNLDPKKGKYTWKLRQPNEDNAEKTRAFRGARCTVFHDDQFYSQGLDWTKKEISGNAMYTKKANYNSMGEQTYAYTSPIPGCLWKHNDEYHTGVSSIEECQKKCNAKGWCLSLDYIQDRKECALSKDTKTSAPSYWYSSCHNIWRPSYYISSIYSAKIDPVTTISRWNDLPKYDYDLVQSCTVGVIFGQTSFVTSGPKGVYYFPIPFNPEENPDHLSYKWENVPGVTDCKAGLGWADGKLVCVPITTWDSTSGEYAKKFHYFEENDEHGARWITRSNYFKDPTDALNSYVTVPGSYDDKCAKFTEV